MFTVLVAAVVAAAAPAGVPLSVDPATSVATYHVRHALHAVDGRSSAIEGKAIVGDDGRVMAMVRIPISSFDSGDANRDANMRDTLEISKFPYVVFKAVAHLPVPAPHGHAFETTLDGELDFHGVRHRLAVPATVTLGDDGGAAVKARLHVSLDAFHVERPSLLFVKLQDDCSVDVDLKLRSSP